jgi:hypothetical protein
MLIIALVVAALAVAWGTRFLTEDRLTVGYRRWVVNKFGEQSLPSYLAHCGRCTSFWVALLVMPVAILFPNRWVLMVLAIPAASYITGRLE